MTYSLNRPVDVTAREAAALEKIEKGREERASQAPQGQGNHPMSRQGSRQARERGPPSGESGWRTPPSSSKSLSASASQSGSPEPDSKGAAGAAPQSNSPRAAPATVRPTFSFAAAARKDTAGPADSKSKDGEDESVAEAAEGIAEASLQD